MKRIPLTQGKFALVDDEDYDFLMQWKWYAQKIRNTFYAKRNIPKLGGGQTAIYMHRFVVNPNKNMQIDHKDGNGLNNQKSNLRESTYKENGMNSGIGVRNKSGFKGVSWSRSNKKWTVQIRINGKIKHIYKSSCPIEAAKAYNAAAILHYGEFARLNEIPA